MSDWGVESVTQVDGSETWFDSQSGTLVINESRSPTNQVLEQLGKQVPEIAAAMGRWRSGISRGQSGIFHRDRFVTPVYLFDQFQTAQDAALYDDVVSGTIGMTEAMAFSKMGFKCNDEDEEDVWNQIGADIDLDARMREMWRELSIVSQVYVALRWKRKTYKVRGKSKDGIKRKKTFRNILVPDAMTLLDPLKVLPIGNFMFGEEELVYIATKTEASQFDKTLAGANSSDLIVRSLLTGRYEATRDEKELIQALCGNVNIDNLFIMNKKNVFRHTLTRPSYQRFAPCEMTSIFEILDLKHQLREMDRASLLGGTNFIVLITIGSDAQPGKPEEVRALAGMAQTAARTPVIVGDARLNVQFLTPAQDQTLKPERYNTLDARITAKMLKLMMTGNYSAGAKGDDSIKLTRVIASGMESRRHMMRRTLEKFVFRPTVDQNDQLDEYPTLRFYPKRIALDFDPSLAQFLQDLRDRGDVSRETVLSEVDIDEDEEATLREREAELYDDIFQPTNVPFFKTAGPDADNPNSGPQKTPPKGAQNPRSGSTNPKAAGRRQGGTKNGGGANPGAGRPPSS